MSAAGVSFDFAGARVLVTGGTSGIGYATAIAFAAAGAEVTVTGRRDSAADYDAHLERFAYRPLDVRDGDAVDRLAASFEVLDVLVNNAGATFPDGRDEWEPDAFAGALAVNLAGAQRLTLGCRAALGRSELPGGASVLNVVSMAAFVAQTLVPGYGAAKAGLVALTRSMAVLWASDGIRVNAVAPGVIDTPMTAPMQHMPELLERELARSPMGRLGAAEEVAAAVLFLSSAASSFTTGTVLAVDGGYLA